jgi:hypothetical protein
MNAAEVDQLILDAVAHGRAIDGATLQQLLRYSARVGFDPAARKRVRGELAGVRWQGRELRGSDRLPPAERHYIKHVLVHREWPVGTSLANYIASLRALILDPSSGVFTSQYQGVAQLGVIGEAGELRGPNGLDLVLVEYRVVTGHWVTAYQPEHGVLDLSGPRRTNLRWLRELTRTNV